jgi:hypothetical protein
MDDSDDDDDLPLDQLKKKKTKKAGTKGFEVEANENTFGQNCQCQEEELT